MFAGVFPVDSSDFPKLEESIKRVPICLIAAPHVFIQFDLSLL